jgi:hypothetical protein
MPEVLTGQLPHHSLEEEPPGKSVGLVDGHDNHALENFVVKRREVLCGG